MDQRQKSWYILFFLSPEAESLLKKDDWALLEAAFGIPPEAKAAMVEVLSKPGLLTGGLNWYRANISPANFADTKPRELPQVQCPVLAVWPTGEQFCNEAQMQASERYVKPGKCRPAPLACHAIVPCHACCASTRSPSYSWCTDQLPERC